MSRLTYKNIVDKEYYPIMIQYSFDKVRKNITNKLGQIEDILEEYGIEDLTDLKIALDYYNHRFDGGVYTERVGKDEQH